MDRFEVSGARWNKPQENKHYSDAAYVGRVTHWCMRVLQQSFLLNAKVCVFTLITTCDIPAASPVFPFTISHCHTCVCPFVPWICTSGRKKPHIYWVIFEAAQVEQLWGGDVLQEAKWQDGAERRERNWSVCSLCRLDLWGQGQEGSRGTQLEQRNFYIMIYCFLRDWWVKLSQNFSSFYNYLNITFLRILARFPTNVSYMLHCKELTGICKLSTNFNLMIQVPPPKKNIKQQLDPHLCPVTFFWKIWKRHWLFIVFLKGLTGICHSMNEKKSKMKKCLFSFLRRFITFVHLSTPTPRQQAGKQSFAAVSGWKLEGCHRVLESTSTSHKLTELNPVFLQNYLQQRMNTHVM